GQRIVDPLEGRQSRRRRGPGFQQREVLRRPTDTAGVHCDVLRVEPSFRIRVVARPHPVPGAHAPDVGTGRGDDARTVCAGYDREPGIRSPGATRTVPDKSVTAAKDGRVERDVDLQ